MATRVDYGNGAAVGLNPGEYRQRVLIGGGDLRAELLGRGWPAGWGVERAAVERPELLRDALEVFAGAGAELVVAPVSVEGGGFSDGVVTPPTENDLKTRGLAAARVGRAVVEAMPGPAWAVGRMLPPRGLAAVDEVRVDALGAAYRTAAAGLVEGGIDAILLSGFVELEPLLAAVNAARAAGEVAVLAGMAFGHGGDFAQSAMGVTLEAAVADLEQAGAAAVVVDSGEFPECAEGLVQMARSRTGLPVYVAMQAGHAESPEGRLAFGDTPVEFSGRLAAVAKAGANGFIAGRGASAGHVAALAAMRKRLRMAAVG